MGVWAWGATPGPTSPHPHHLVSNSRLLQKPTCCAPAFKWCWPFACGSMRHCATVLGRSYVACQHSVLCSWASAGRVLGAGLFVEVSVSTCVLHLSTARGQGKPRQRKPHMRRVLRYSCVSVSVYAGWSDEPVSECCWVHGSWRYVCSRLLSAASHPVCNLAHASLALFAWWFHVCASS